MSGALQELYLTLIDTLVALSSPRVLKAYFGAHTLDLLTRLLSLLSLLLAITYTEEDLRLRQVSFLDKESILSLTAVLQWVHQFKILKVRDSVSPCATVCSNMYTCVIPCDRV